LEKAVFLIRNLAEIDRQAGMVGEEALIPAVYRGFAGGAVRPTGFRSDGCLAVGPGGGMAVRIRRRVAATDGKMDSDRQDTRRRGEGFPTGGDGGHPPSSIRRRRGVQGTRGSQVVLVG